MKPKKIKEKLKELYGDLILEYIALKTFKENYNDFGD